MTESKPHGGPRKGAGRPKSANSRVWIGAKVLPETKAKLEAKQEKTGLSLGKVLDFLTKLMP